MVGSYDGMVSYFFSIVGYIFFKKCCFDFLFVVCSFDVLYVGLVGKVRDMVGFVDYCNFEFVFDNLCNFDGGFENFEVFFVKFEEGDVVWNLVGDSVDCCIGIVGV